MPAPIRRTRMLSQFACLGDRCADTCCHGWSMQVDEPTLKKYRERAPELMNAVEPGGLEATTIMRKNPGTGFCVKLEGGLCGIHKKYGADLLGDACYFYPRVTRTLGKTALMTASASCPEIARLLFILDDPFALEQATTDRLPYAIKDYLPPGFAPEQALAVHQAFLEAVNDTAPVERILARIHSVGASLELLPVASWPEAVPFYFKNADSRLPEPEPNEADTHNLLLALAGLIVASHKPVPDRLKQTIREMEQALAVSIDWQHMRIDTTPKSGEALSALKARWRDALAARYDLVLRRWLQMQLSLMLFPFAGLGKNHSERVTIIGVRFATFKLALACACVMQEGTLPEETVVRVAQSLSRFLDHLGDATFSLSIYSETGWTREARWRGVVES